MLIRKIFTLLIIALYVVNAQAQPTEFTSGNIVALLVTPNPNGYTQTSSTAAKLVEYTTAGTATNFAVTIPNTTAGNRLLLGASNPFEGQMTLSENGGCLCFAGYDVAAWSNTTTQIAAPKVIAKVSKSGYIDLSTKIPTTSAFNNSTVRGVASVDGNSFWISGGVSDNSNGTRYILRGSTDGGTLIAPNRYQSLAIFNSKLYVSDFGIKYFQGTDLPTAAASTTNVGASSTNTTQFVFLDTDAGRSWNGTGYDVLYIADAKTDYTNSGTGITKYYVNTAGDTWISAGTYDVAGGQAIPAITGTVENGNPVLYAVKGSAVPTTSTSNSIIKIVDAAGRTNAMAAGTTTVTNLVTSATNTFFKGIAFAPTLATLPLSLTSFKAVLNNQETALQWTTESEVNVKEFVIERKGAFDTDFSSIGTVPAKNISSASYRFLDASLNAGENYYRLKMVDNDGSSKYSEIEVVKLSDLTEISFSLSPNPVQDKVTITHPKAGSNAKALIYSMNGGLLKSINISKNTTQTSFDASALAPGQYVLIYTNDGDKKSLKFVK